MGDLSTAGAAETARRVVGGEVSARGVVELALRRIDERDPGLNAFSRVLVDEAIAEAEARDSTLASGAPTGPLHGVPIAIKEEIDVAGNPAASVPCGTAADGLPVGVQLVGRTDDEATLFSLSAQLERIRPWPLVAP